MLRMLVPVLLLLSLSQAALAAGEAWTCTSKDGKVIEVKGASANDKKMACEALKGKWAKAQPKKEAAGGGGW